MLPILFCPNETHYQTNFALVPAIYGYLFVDNVICYYIPYFFATVYKYVVPSYPVSHLTIPFWFIVFPYTTDHPNENKIGHLNLLCMKRNVNREHQHLEKISMPSCISKRIHNCCVSSWPYCCQQTNLLTGHKSFPLHQRRRYIRLF